MKTMPNGQFKEIKKQTLFEAEEEILDFWKKNKIFEKSLKKNPEEKIFSFYDGPPFITGLPSYATLLPSIAKDIIPRYKTMKGFNVPRVWGWDVHGLPAENQVEKQLGLKAKHDIEELGIDKFIRACRLYVSDSSTQWRWYIDHVGRWADMDGAYRTDNLEYMETVIWIFKELYEKDLIYKGRRVSLYCPRCATPLSKFETTMDQGNYKDVEDETVTIAFKLKNKKDTSMLAWTTTPWTLMGNAALAVSPDINYATITDGNKKYILAKDAIERYPEFKRWKVVKEELGKKLVGLEYEPLYKPDFDANAEKDFHIYGADFVSIDEGTGIVHMAPAFGEDDFNLGQKMGISAPLHIDDEGKFLDSIPYEWAGAYFKKANRLIADDLKKRGILVKTEKIVHSYPHCYRCGTPLIYKAQESWYLRIDPIRKELLDTNKKIKWVPEHFGSGRFKYNIENAPDWSLSRTRYWGTPLPVWETEDGERIVCGSIEEIERLSGKKITDLHRPLIDDVVLTTPSGKKAYRVKEVLDCWFESGAMPYAQSHYPFENKKTFEMGFPTDFITEYTGQLRGWFYYLHVLGNALKHSNAFKNVVVTGVLMGTDGRKMSKSYGNYPDPKTTMTKYGAESLRLYFMGSKIMSGEDLNLNEEDIREQHGLLKILSNSYKYFITYANLHNWHPAETIKSEHALDRWINVRLEQFIKEYSDSLDEFDFVTSTRAIRPFIEDLSTWYIRRSRNRFVAGDTDALGTLYNALIRFSIAVAPTLPFSAETMYRNLKPENSRESVHLEDYPEADEKLISNNEALLENMKLARSVASAAHTLRSEIGQPVRQKLGTLILENSKGIEKDEALINLLKDEANVLEIKFNERPGKTFVSTEIENIKVSLDKNITKELEKEGVFRELTRQLQAARKTMGLNVGQKAVLKYEASDKLVESIIEERKDELSRATNFSEIKKGSGESEILNGKLKIKIEV